MPTTYVPFPYGTATAADLREWTEHRTAPADESARQEARRLGQVADAYAHGWIAGRSDRMAPADITRAEEAAYLFGHEYEQAAWLYATGQRGSRDGYARAWERVCELHNL